jgi:(p)ppGpp synthase/HD superfamily hydrolase
MSTLERAIAIAAEAHTGQTDKGDQPYILHPLRLMMQMRTDDQRRAAVLHDVVEDSDWTLDQLRSEGFSEPVVQAVDALTKRDGEPYDAFARRAAADPIARVVKIADIRDNMDLSRIPNPTRKDHARLENYRRALVVLEGGS